MKQRELVDLKKEFDEQTQFTNALYEERLREKTLEIEELGKQIEKRKGEAKEMEARCRQVEIREH